MCWRIGLETTTVNGHNTTYQMRVHIFLNLRQIATNDLNELGWQMLCIQGIDSSQDKFIDDATHLVLDLHHAFFLSRSGIGLAAFQNGEQHVFAEFLLRSQDAIIGKIRHGEELL